MRHRNAATLNPASAHTSATIHGRAGFAAVAESRLTVGGIYPRTTALAATPRSGAMFALTPPPLPLQSRHDPVVRHRDGWLHRRRLQFRQAAGAADAGCGGDVRAG